MGEVPVHLLLPLFPKAKPLVRTSATASSSSVAPKSPPVGLKVTSVPPNAAPVTPKSTSERPKAKAKLSDPVIDLGTVSPHVVSISSVPSDQPVVRIMLDFNGVSNVDIAEGPAVPGGYSGIAIEQIEVFLKVSPYHRVDICRYYIGKSGLEHLSCRRNLVRYVVELNEYLVDIANLPPQQKVALTISADKLKSIITSDVCSIHCFKVSMAQACLDNLQQGSLTH